MDSHSVVIIMLHKDYVLRLILDTLSFSKHQNFRIIICMDAVMLHLMCLKSVNLQRFPQVIHTILILSCKLTHPALPYLTSLSNVARRRSTRSDANELDHDRKDKEKEKEKVIVPSRVKRVSVATSSFLSVAGSASPRSLASYIPSVQPVGPAEDIKYQVRNCILNCRTCVYSCGFNTSRSCRFPCDFILQYITHSRLHCLPQLFPLPLPFSHPYLLPSFIWNYFTCRSEVPGDLNVL
jgi:hypothetical protein